MNKKALVGVGVVIAGLLFVTMGFTRKINIEAGVLTGPLRYVGSTMLLPDVLGDCWPIIYTVNVYDPDSGEYVPPADAVNYTMENGTLCYIEVLEPCTIYNFVRV